MKLRLLVLLVTVLVFGPALAGGFCWDDGVLIVHNTVTASLSALPRAFTQDLWASTPKVVGATGYYRPLLLVDLGVDRLLFGLSPLAHRAHSLAWHLAAVWLLWGLLRRLKLSAWASTAGTMSFAVHPAQVEAVVFVSARNDLMATAALFAALHLLARDRVDAPCWVGGALAVFAAALSKETAVIAPAVLALYELARGASPLRLRPQLAVLLGLVGAVGLRLWAGVGLPSGGLAGLPAVLGPVTAWQAQALLWPVGRVPGLHLGWASAPPWSALLAGLSLALVAGLWGGRRAWAGLGLAALAGAPALVAVSRLGLVSDRYLYLPLAGLALALAATLERLDRRVQIGALVALTLASAWAAAPAVAAWHDDRTLWTAAVERWGGAYTQGTLARELEDEGDLDGAARLYVAATQAPRPFSESCWRVAAVQLRRGDPRGAAREGLRALDAGCPREPELLAPTAVGLAATGDWTRAERLADEAEPDPTGQAVVVRVAAALRRGDPGPLQAAAPEPRAQAALRERAEWLIGQGDGVPGTPGDQ